MRYLSIDIETTGLEPDKDQILAFAAVLDTLETRHLHVTELPFFYVPIRHERYHGNAIALSMNAELMRTIGEDDDELYTIRPDQLFESFTHWLHAIGVIGRRYVAAGKNFASFDRQFLNHLDGRFKNLFHHRSLDPGTLFAKSCDEVPPSTEECGHRAGLKKQTDKVHDAVEDARYVVRLLRAGLFGGRFN